jgi:hypothetical protein
LEETILLLTKLSFLRGIKFIRLLETLQVTTPVIFTDLLPREFYLQKIAAHLKTNLMESTSQKYRLKKNFFSFISIFFSLLRGNGDYR